MSEIFGALGLLGLFAGMAFFWGFFSQAGRELFKMILNK